MYGMNLLQKGKDLLNTWICEKKVSDKNLFLRAYCFNNKSLMTEYEKIFASESSAKDLLDYSKQGFTVFKEADAAFDSWLGSIEGKKFITTRDFKAFDKLFYWMSLMLNTALKEFGNLRLKTLHVSQINVVATAGAYTHTARLLYLRSGDFAQQVPLARLMYNLEFREAARASLPQNAGVNYTYRNTRATEIKNAVTLSVKGKPEITKNRILAIVGIFELLNFYFQYDAWKNDLKDKPELSVQLVGASFLVSAVAFDMLGENWLHKGATVASKAQALRLFAASLGTIGGVIGLMIEHKTLKDTDDKILKNLLRIRYAAGVLLTLGQALSLFSTILSYSSSEIVKRISGKITTNMLASVLMGARAVASLTLITVATVALEIFLRNCVLDDAMQNWCQKSAFRKIDSDEKPFKSESEEYEEFTKAIMSV
ncbi:T6SS effector BTH_I2691 family protein [Acinetobacter haemolyticus]|nr:T6SS effector BTH_I2691 family protein [Acinetobacter haemolyticus]